MSGTPVWCCLVCAVCDKHSHGAWAVVDRVPITRVTRLAREDNWYVPENRGGHKRLGGKPPQEILCDQCALNKVTMPTSTRATP
jgi:hypothetical protein